MKTIKHLYTLLAVMLLGALPAAAQNTTDDKNKAIIETQDGNRELNTDEISVIRFDGGKVTVVHSEGETTFDRTLRSLSFQRPNPGTLRLTATTSIGTEGAGNRAQSIDKDDGGKLKATWADGDVVYVYATASSTTSIGTLTPTSYGDKTATLTGNIDATNLSEGQTLYFSTQPRPFNFSSQDGTVENLFYFTATAPVTIVGGNASVSDLDFTRPFAVVKFTLKDKGNSDAAISAKSFTVHDGTNTYTVTPAAATNVLYVGIPDIDTKTLTLTATDGNDYYLYQRAGVTFANNLYYPVTVKMEASDLARPLTFEAIEAGAKVTFIKNNISSNSLVNKIEYSIDGGTTWEEYDFGINITLEHVGDKVSFRGTNTKYAFDPDNHFCSFFCTNDCYIYGNIMSLIDKNDFVNVTSLSGNYTFCKMFYNNSYIFSHPSKKLVLPATTLTDACYRDMFEGCTSLTTAPALPATTLTDACYRDMFEGCTSLTTAPALPAMTLADGCYFEMFYGCTNLTTAPALPAMTLAENCYNGMFLACESLTTAPELPATTLQQYCYYGMFEGCTNLNSVTCLATNISAKCCTASWLSCVAATGTFYKPESMNDWSVKTGVSGIPSGWTVKSYESLLPLTFEAKTAGAQVTFTEGSNVSISPLEYSTDGTTWSTYTSGTPITLTNAGDKVSFRGNNKTYAAGSSDNCNFSCTAGCYVYGNIMSLINKDNFATNTTLTDYYAFAGLFAKNDHLYNHADKTLLLPATTLLPYCYQDMFQGCTSLTTAPALPATTLTENCYNGMFHGCTSLTKAPVLPATTLATGCYYIMFQGCENLNSVTCLATNISADGCTTNWLDGVADTGTFYKSESMDDWTTNSASGIPSGWTVVNAQ